MSEAAHNTETNAQEMVHQFCGFMIDGDMYAVPVLEVQEVIRAHPATVVPLSDTCIRGLINLRGQIVTPVNLRKVFGLTDYSEDQDYMNVIIKNNDSLYSIMVDEICDVIDVEGSSFESTPDTIDTRLRMYVSGVHKLEDRLLIVLDLKKLLNSINNQEGAR
ncbi:MAG: chemotaxis protein CheW [Bdellovibrionales bacterium]|nr:chemotaxis protein CheW [Bdellovibrionales bacterium]